MEKHSVKLVFNSEYLAEQIHRAFHYRVCRWLQKHGADLIR